MSEVLNKQVGGSHYKEMKIQPVKFIVDNNIPYREANAIKYICRHSKKNGADDIRKAIHYLEMILEEDYPDKVSSDVIRTWEGTVELDRPLESVTFYYK